MQRRVIVSGFHLLSKAAGAVLLLFTLRRWLYTLAAILPHSLFGSRILPTEYLAQGSVGELPITDDRLPTVLLLVPVRNEAPNLPELLAALAKLDYPVNQLVGVFVDDASQDDSAAILASWIAGRPNWHLLSLPSHVGKAAALNAALAHFADGDLIAIYDADERPFPDALRYLVGYFADRRVGAVSGRRIINNSLDGPAASYVTFEALVHQEITARARDRLALAPPILGSNCAYRRTALSAVGLFRPGALLEDSDLTLRLARAGWRTRFVPDAISAHAAPATAAGYWRQHSRWSRGFYNVASHQLPALMNQSGLPLLLRLELLTFSLGYLDRVALLLAAAAILVGQTCPGVRSNDSSRLRLNHLIAASLLTPLLQILIALRLAGAPRRLIRQLMWLPLFFTLDLAIAMTSLVAALLFASLNRLNILRRDWRPVIAKRRHVTAHCQTGE